VNKDVVVGGGSREREDEGGWALACCAGVGGRGVKAFSAIRFSGGGCVDREKWGGGWGGGGGGW